MIYSLFVKALQKNKSQIRSECVLPRRRCPWSLYTSLYNPLVIAMHLAPPHAPPRPRYPISLIARPLYIRGLAGCGWVLGAQRCPSRRSFNLMETRFPTTGKRVLRASSSHLLGPIHVVPPFVGMLVSTRLSGAPCRSCRRGS